MTMRILSIIRLSAITLSAIASVSATLPPIAEAQEESPVIRLDSALANIVPSGAKVEKLADGFGFLEGPVWVRKGGGEGEGYLVFSDIPAT